MKRILCILDEELLPAEGCTEPIAIAFAAAKLTEVMGKVPDSISVSLSGNIIKNVKSVKIPNASGLVGIEAAIAMGAILGDAKKDLMVISSVDKSRFNEVGDYLKNHEIAVNHSDNPEKLYIKATGVDGEHEGFVEIKNYHTNITRIELDGKCLFKLEDEHHCECSDVMTDRKFLNIEYIYNVCKTVDLALVKNKLKAMIEMNSAIAREGLKNDYGIGIGKTIYDGIKNGVYGNDLKNNMVAFTAAGSDARMNGCSMPVMTVSGSGNQGMTSSLPLIKYSELMSIDEDHLLRGLLFSILATVHIKDGIGRLSAYCGAIAASAAVSGAIAFLDGLSVERCGWAIETTLGTMSGLVCDGAKSSCATKIASGISAAFDGYYSAKIGRRFMFGEGIVGADVEATIDHVGILACDGMQSTDDVILDVMLHNGRDFRC